MLGVRITATTITHCCIRPNAKHWCILWYPNTRLTEDRVASADSRTGASDGAELIGSHATIMPPMTVLLYVQAQTPPRPQVACYSFNSIAKPCYRQHVNSSERGTSPCSSAEHEVAVVLAQLSRRSCGSPQQPPEVMVFTQGSPQPVFRAP